MKYSFFTIVSVLFLCSCMNNQKPALRQGVFYTEEQGKAELKKMELLYSNHKEWEDRKLIFKENIGFLQC